MTGDEIKAARKALGMNQDDFARALKFNSGRYIRDLEKGRRTVTPRTEALLKTLTEGKQNG